ncbi:MAG: heme-binding protein [Balneolaceae bacterium]|nr:MAG: heme-binding protein [Balneolaceae bacterium]
MWKTTMILVITLLFMLPDYTFARQSETMMLTLDDATRIADAAQARAEQDNWTVVIAVVDEGGHLLLLRRLDGTQLGSVEIAIQKAKTAVYYKRPTKAFQDGVAAGNVGILNLPNVLPFEGGIPVMHNGKAIGAIGVSGVTAAQDGIIGQAGLDAL